MATLAPATTTNTKAHPATFHCPACKKDIKWGFVNHRPTHVSGPVDWCRACFEASGKTDCYGCSVTIFIDQSYRAQLSNGDTRMVCQQCHLTEFKNNSS